MRGARLLLALSLVAAPLCAPLAAVAQESVLPSAPVLTLDQERLFADSRFGQAVIARHEAEVEALKAENRRIEAALEAEELALTQRRASLPAAEFQSLATAFDTKAEGIRAAQTAKDRALLLRLDEERQRFFDAAGPVLAALLEEAGAMAIIDKRAVILGFDRIDMTAAAIRRLDETLGDGAAATADPP
ncbi:MAG: hypothetical protein RIR62_267 [Pseudomonadota bacterium]|jgi:Skp family chaperone for outer membrane proteins